MYDPTPPTTWFSRARYSPARDVLRGVFSARLDPRTLIAAANLPEPLPVLVYTVVQRSRLWLREKLDVTREMIAHFADGLESGRTAEQLATDFGPPDQAARLIRRGKIRNRPWPWHAARFTLRALVGTTAAIVVVYALMMARFYFSVPEISRNYWVEANRARAADPDDAAWPFYREAITKLGSHGNKETNPRVDSDWIEQGPTGKHWPDLVAIVNHRQDVIELVRKGAKRSRLGYLLGNPEDQAYFREHADWLVTTQSADQNLPLLNALLPGPQEMRELERLLRADAAVAATTSDGTRVVEDFMALLAMSEQLWQPRSFLVEQLISLAVFGQTLQAIGDIVANRPDCLTDEQLRALAHRLAAYRGGNIAMDFTAEKALFDDILQRAYTDDGNGDGHVTAAGLNLMSNIAEKKPPDYIPDVTWLIGPGLSALIAGRAETRDVADRFFEELISARQGPPWQWDAERIAASENWLKDLAQGTLAIRYAFPSLLLPSNGHVSHAAERAIQCRDATEVAIALVLFQRRHGVWPQKLDELVPDLLPAVPPDRLDGQPLRYVVRDGRPLLYTLGNDRDDDGGRPTKNPNQAIPGPYGPVEHPKTEPDYDGDWILWPPLPPESTPAPEEIAPVVEE